MRDREKQAKYNKQYRQDHKLERAEYEKQYRQDNKLEMAKRHKQWCQDNKPKIAKQRRRLYRKDREAWLVFFKDIHCAKCGYNKCFAAIDFHHIDPAQKEYAISVMIRQGATPKQMERVTEEIKKCIVLCSNCHRELHASQDKQDEPYIK